MGRGCPSKNLGSIGEKHFFFEFYGFFQRFGSNIEQIFQLFFPRNSNVQFSVKSKGDLYAVRQASEASHSASTLYSITELILCHHGWNQWK